MRHPNWDQRLTAYAAKIAIRPHVWSQHDCLMLAAGGVRAVTGKDFARGHRGKYDSLASAYRYLKETFGAETPAQLFDQLFEPKAVGFAGRGDLLLCHVDAVAGAGGEPMPGDVPALCLGRVAIVAGDKAGQLVPRGERWLKAWAVGEHHSGDSAKPGHAQ